jgi:hypothetical protein
MPYPNAYPELQDVRDYLRANTAQALPTGDDSLIGNLLAGARAFVESPAGAGRRFQVTADTTRRFDALADVDQGGRRLWLDEDLCQITSVTNGDGVAVPGSAYVTEPRNETPYHAITIKLNSSQIWTYDDSPEGAIVIVGRWGYSTQAPPEIAHATLRLAVWLYRQRASSSGDVDRPVVTGDGVTILPSAVPADVMAVLRAHRRLC